MSVRHIVAIPIELVAGCCGGVSGCRHTETCMGGVCDWRWRLCWLRNLKIVLGQKIKGHMEVSKLVQSCCINWA